MQICESKRGLTIKISKSDLEEAVKLRAQYGPDLLIRLLIETNCKALPHFYHILLNFNDVIPPTEVPFPVAAGIYNVKLWDTCQLHKKSEV